MNINILDEGISIATIGYLIVFAALTFLYFFFSLIPKAIRIWNKRGENSNETKTTEKNKAIISGNVVAAISMTIHMYMNEKHDEESYDLTIKKISKRYSPWSSKIYSMNNINKKF